jgi:hypothetical protein
MHEFPGPKQNEKAHVSGCAWRQHDRSERAYGSAKRFPLTWGIKTSNMFALADNT